MKALNKERLSFDIILLGIFILGVVFCRDRFLGITQYYYILYFIIFILIFDLTKRRFSIRIEQKCILFLFVYLGFNLINYKERVVSGVYISYISYLVLFFLISLKKHNKREVKFLINSYLISSLIISLLILISKTELDGWVNTHRYTIKSIDTYIDPNYIASFISIGLIIAFNKVLINIKKKIFYFNLIIVIINLNAIFYTGSRAAILTIFICLVISCIIQKKYKILILLSIILILILLLKVEHSYIIDRILNNYLDGSNIKRMNNWFYGIKSILKKLILGYGFIDSSTILNLNFGYNSAIHSTYILMLSSFGIIGVIPFIIILANIIKDFFNKELKIFLSVIISLGITSIFIEQNLTITFWMSVIILYKIKELKINYKDFKLYEII